MTETRQNPRLACLEVRGGNERARYAIQLPGISAWVCCRPITPSVRGGDLHYFSVCSHGFVSRIALADVAGHGDLVSAIADRLRVVLRKNSDAWDQSDVVRELNDAFMTNASGALEYATAVVLSHYSESGEMLFTNAGHLPPLWYRAETKEWNFLLESTPYAKQVTDLPLGLISGTPYSQTAVELRPDDLLVMYTDGVTDSMGEHGKPLDKDGLLAIARSAPLGPAAEIGPALVAGLEAFRGTNPVEDDETFVVLQCVPRSPDDLWPGSVTQLAL